MKNLIKVFGITVLVAVIGFSFAGCGDGSGNGGGGGGTGGGWPPTNVRNNYGIGGLNQPPGSNFGWAETSLNGTDYLNILFTPTSNTLSGLSSGFTSIGKYLSEFEEKGGRED